MRYFFLNFFLVCCCEHDVDAGDRKRPQIINNKRRHGGGPTPRRECFENVSRFALALLVSIGWIFLIINERKNTKYINGKHEIN